jgi:cytochrome c553
VKSAALKLLTLSVLACWIGPVLAADIPDSDKKAAAKMATETCAGCHGVGGRSTAPTFPRLAAQTPAYIEAQLKAFRDQTRGDPDAIAYMWGMASQLSDGTISALADYFSQQRPATGSQGNPAAIAAGREIYEKGVPAKQIPACETCHGKGGVGAGAFPRLAGQHAPYLFKQMLVIQNALRSAPVMHGIVQELTPTQMQAVAAYLESL